MKNLIRSLVLCACFLLMFTNASVAQSTQFTVTGGHLELTIDPTYAAYLADNGITVTYSKMYLEENGFKIVKGDLDKKTGAGEVSCFGKLTYTSGATKVELMGLRIDTTKPSEPTIEAMVVINGVFVGRQAVFGGISGLPYSLPLKAGKNVSSVGYLRGQHFLKVFQLPNKLEGPLVGTYIVTVSLEKSVDE